MATSELTCQVCGDRFRQFTKLRSHMVLHDVDEKSHKCEFCGKLFSKSSNLNAHMRTHTGEKPYQCSLCKKFFPRMNNLRSHIMRIHAIVREDADDYILVDGKVPEKMESEDSNLMSDGVNEDSNQEMSDTPLIENGTMLYETESYRVQADLVKCLNQENGGTVETSTRKIYYTCKICSKVMHHKANMNDHVRSHSGVKLFQCRLCGKGLSRKQNLIHHLKHIHFLENERVNENILRTDGPSNDMQYSNGVMEENDHKAKKIVKIRAFRKKIDYEKPFPDIDSSLTNTDSKMVVSNMDASEIDAVQGIDAYHETSTSFVKDNNNSPMKTEPNTVHDQEYCSDIGFWSADTASNSSPIKMESNMADKQEHFGDLGKMDFWSADTAGYNSQMKMEPNMADKQENSGDLESVGFWPADTAGNSSPMKVESSMANKLEHSGDLESTGFWPADTVDAHAGAPHDIDGEVPIDNNTDTPVYNDVDLPTDTSTDVGSHDNAVNYMADTPVLDLSHLYTAKASTITIKTDDAEKCMKRTVYTCNVCSKVIAHKANMEAHVRSHSGYKMFRCHICGKGLARKRNLTNHLKQIHFLGENGVEKISETNEIADGLNKENEHAATMLKQKGKRKLNSGPTYSKKIKSDVAENIEGSASFASKNESSQESHLDVESDRTVPDASQSELKQSMFVTEGGNNKTDSIKPESTSPLKSKCDDDDESENVHALHTDGTDYANTDTVIKHEASSSVTRDEDQSDEVSYIVHNANDPSQRFYECKLCGLKCKRRYYLTHEHMSKHTTIKPFLCVVCCKAFSRRYTLRGHLIKEHSFSGSELDGILEATAGSNNARVQMSGDAGPNYDPARIPDQAPETINNNTDCDNLSKETANEHSAVDNVANGTSLFADFYKDHDDRNTCQDPTENDGTSHSSTDEYDIDPTESPEGMERNVEAFPADESMTGNSIADNDQVLQTTDEDPNQLPRSITADNSMLTTTDLSSAEMRESKTMAADGLSNGVDAQLQTSDNSNTHANQTVSNRRRAKKTKLAPHRAMEVEGLMDIKNMNCLYCQKKCSNKSNLKQHIRFVHLNLKEFQCNVCAKTFNTRFNLKVHMKQHNPSEEVKQLFECSTCLKSFTTKSYLKVHTVNMHGIGTNTMEKPVS